MQIMEIMKTYDLMRIMMTQPPDKCILLYTSVSHIAKDANNKTYDDENCVHPYS